MSKIFVLSVYSPFNWKRPLSYISIGIRKVLRFKWHHTAFLYVNDLNEMFILESDIKGVVKTCYKDWVKEKEITIHSLYPVINSEEHIPPALTEEQIIKRASLKIDEKTRYDFGGLLFHHILNQAFGLWVGPTEPRKADRRFTCSEYIAWGLKWYNSYKVTPKDIYNTLPILGYFKASDLNVEILNNYK